MCVCETEKGVVRGMCGDGSRAARRCVVQLWEAVGVYMLCVRVEARRGG